MNESTDSEMAVLREDKPYELLDIDGNSVSREEARKIILAKYQVPEEIRREMRRLKTLGSFKLQKKLREMLVPGAHEAATAPQPAVFTDSAIFLVENRGKAFKNHGFTRKFIILGFIDLVGQQI